MSDVWTTVARERAALGDDPAATLAEFRSKQDSTEASPGPKTSWLGEAIVHSEDIRRPLGIRHTCSPGAVRRVIDFYKGSNVLIDVLVAATGRGVACDALTDDGVATLRERCA
ncbi:hypothetical protein EKO23_19180 [Nocardioides guangzhouensis]|uniref:Uncharacterized protein n=1 Tax=Nocardioides guangzhouensis TaxID=2497878 RepID=A0A4Q4Z8B0_9ACTN|nr:hypothetical protein [Nocardioides guangzhouensis]RYP83421.1 hypothetical protein EKO23_19180 [Nocardioides guangzhouensis]